MSLPNELIVRDNVGMGTLDRLVVIFTKFISLLSTMLGLGAGETWPGEIALRLRPSITSVLVHKLPDGVILVAGTNGKTTTSLMVKTILEHIGDTVVHNATGANLLNGIVSSFIRNADWLGRVRADVGIFEIDENSLPVILRYVSPKRIILLNLFRDQLDRYGEVDVIVEKWIRALSKLPKDTVYILNGDDPGIAFIGAGVKGNIIYFGLQDTSKYLGLREHATDSTFCPWCGHRLTYDGVYYSHIGVWRCGTCGHRRPAPSVYKWPSTLPGLYNQYNTLAAVALAKSMQLSDTVIKKSLHSFTPAFGRQEEILAGGKTIKLFLSKNPAGFNASLRTVLEMGAQEFLIVLNDRIPDGRDVSWIWDVDFETIPDTATVLVSGDRAYDMALRMKYALVPDKKVTGKTPEPRVFPLLWDALTYAQTLRTDKPMYILATYSAMLDVRKILKGRKIL